MATVSWIEDECLPDISSLESIEDLPSSPKSCPSAESQGVRCKHIIHLEQLQEYHNRTLIKLAEAENTIDRLRVKMFALYPHPPEPQRLLQRENKETPKVLTLDVSASPPLNEQNRHQETSSVCPSTTHPIPQVGQLLTQFLSDQVKKFHQKLQTFKDPLRRKTLKPEEQMKGVSQLVEEMDSLEKSFLLTRSAHKLLQQQGADFGHFDPEQELEGLILQCGLSLKELKEQLEELTSPNPNQTSSQTPPQSSPGRPVMNEQEAAAVEVNSSIQENKEETLKPLKKTPPDHTQSLTVLHENRRDEVLHSAALRPEEERERPTERTIKEPELQVLPQRVCRVLRQSTSPPVPCSSSRRSVELSESHSSSLSSLTDSAASQRRNSTLQTQIRRVCSQDGLISSGLDSGFADLESSSLTRAAATKRLHQREPKSVSAPQEEKSGQITALSAAVVQQETLSQPHPDLPRRRRCSCSPQRRICRLDESRAESGSTVYCDSLSISSSSPAASRHRGDSLRAPTCSQVTHPRSHSPLLYDAPTNSRHPSSGVRGQEEVNMRSTRSLSLNRQLYEDGSLDRAIRAAHHMRRTSAHMAYTLK